MGRSTVQGSTCFLEAEGEGLEDVEGEPVEYNIFGVACSLDAWWGGRDGIGKDSSNNCIFCSPRFSETQRGSWEGVGWGAGSSSISSSALDDEAGWRVRDLSWVEDVESSSSVNGSASYFEWEWRGRIYAEGELAGNIICCSAGTFDAEWGGRDGVGNESGDYSIISSARCLAT
jgi:hypothetical protein